MTAATSSSFSALTLPAECVRAVRANVVPMRWMLGALAMLSVAYRLSPGRVLAKQLPPPRMSRVLHMPASQRAQQAGLRSRSSLQKFLFLWRIAVPSWRARAARTMLLQALLMLLRTVAAVYMARLNGVLGKAVVRGNVRALLSSLLVFGLCFTPAALLDVTLEYLAQMQELYFRENLTRYFDRRYLREKVFYRLAGLHDVDLVDQRITDDVQRWSLVSSRVIISIARPLTEALTFSLVMARQTGWRGPALTWGYYLVFVVLAVVGAPNIDWMTNQRQEREGAFRTAHQSVLTHAEEIAMMHGYRYETAQMARLFDAIADQSRYAAFVYSRFNLMETLYNKYGSVLASYGIIAAAMFGPRNAAASTDDMLAQFGELAFVYKTLAKAVGRLLWNIKLCLAINGYTQRVYQLVEGIDVADVEVLRQYGMLTLPCRDVSTSGSPSSVAPQVMWLADASTQEPHGQTVLSDYIEFVDVPLTLPNGEVLCDHLSFYVKPGMNMLIVGPNGCGKTSTFRLLGELWPLRSGQIRKPEREQLYYVPQRPYMYDGTLFEQIIYPTSRKQAKVSESELYSHLERAGLEYIFSKPDVSWNARLSWADDTFSMGEKQRLAMARLFYHKPRFAILDECSSSLDHDVERRFYEQCRELGITVITIAHRRSVWQYHNWILYFDGNGGYVFSPLRFEDGVSTLVLTRVVSASDPACIGEEMVIHVTGSFDNTEDVDKAVARGVSTPASLHPLTVPSQ